MVGYTPISTRNDEYSPQLNLDIISRIFSLNADMEHETKDTYPALVTLRNSSQVCASWRQLAIGSPLLWAQVLNLDFLFQSDQWMKEVLRRTGTALLHIKSIDYSDNKWPLSIYPVQWLLTEHWKRIRSLDLQLGSAFDRHDQLWYHWCRIFQCPAPSLEVFRFSWPSGDECFTAPHFSLFSDHAPSLRSLDVKDMPVHLTSLLILAPNLRNLVLWSSFSTFNLFSALTEMPLLERLEMKGGVLRENTQQSVPQVITLPRLTTVKFATVRLSLDAPLDTTLAFLERIIPADGCALDFLGFAVLEISDQNSRDLYGRILSRYSQFCTELQTATNLEATLLQDYISLSVNLSSNRRFCFGIKNTQFPEGTMATVLSSFTGMRLDTVNMLTLYFSHAPPRCNLAVTKFVQALNSVEELKTNCSTLNFLQDLQRCTAAVTFPALRIIHLGHTSKPDRLSSVADFINSSVKLGIPLDTLTVKMRGSSTADVETLKNFVPSLAVRITA